MVCILCFHLQTAGAGGEQKQEWNGPATSESVQSARREQKSGSEKKPTELWRQHAEGWAATLQTS